MSDKREAFERYLVKCDVPRCPEPSGGLVPHSRRRGRLVLAHPGDPNGTSLVPLTPVLHEQLSIIRIPCWGS